MKSTRERFDEMTLPVTESGCLLWVGCCNSHGYGVLSVNNAQRFAHRLAWEFSHGAIPDNRIVMHKCDVPCCVNVRHLSLGTYADNMADKMNKAEHIERIGSTTQILEDVTRMILQRAACVWGDMARRIIRSAARKDMAYLKDNSNALSAQWKNKKLRNQVR